MSDFTFSADRLDASLRNGLSAFAMPEHLTLADWAEKHFYLSKESSYVEQRWQPWPFQRAIMSAISNDDVEEIDVIKSARVGYTKIALAAIGYFAHHKRRNQAIWQPTDDDAVEFVKTEIDPMLRDVEAMQEIFPSFLRRDKDNTLSQKKFLGSIVYIRGGKAAKNYRRISVDVAILDELDAFDASIEREGSAVSLSAKRAEGASFPKKIRGSTPKIKHFSQIEDCANSADLLFHYHIPCPHCDEYHALTWGGKEERHGIKFVNRDPDSVRHCCPHCGALIEQHEYLAVAARGRWQASGGETLDNDGNFFCREGNAIDAPRHVAFHVWTAYSPNVEWPAIVREFLEAKEKADIGDLTKMQAFVNTTLGETWAESVKTTEANELQQRAEPYKLRIVPKGGLVLLSGVDTQDDRLEAGIWALGRGCEMWPVDHHIFYGNPEQDEVWERLEEYLFTEFQHASGRAMRLSAIAVDSRGHNTQAVYAWCHKHRKRGVFAIAGHPGRERAIVHGCSDVDLNWKGRRVRQGVKLWQVGTNHAKDRILARLSISKPGAGYIHFSDELSDEWFKQFAGEVRVARQTDRGEEFKWKAIRKRVEALDCCVYAVFLEAYFQLDRRAASYWDKLEQAVQPVNGDLFAPKSKTPDEPEEQKLTPPAPSTTTKKPRSRSRRSSNFATAWRL